MQERVWACVPTPQAVLQVPELAQLPQYFVAPRVQAISREPAPEHGVPHVPAQERVWVCVAVPHVSQPPELAQVVQ